ncbi:restriction endonuclease subunit S, partial [archaeon]|nr:restriction endonuclease subunit S [Nanoarchaeota archaeon]MCG2724292.1 restriction endonuclease subunit S [archaeon]
KLLTPKTKDIDLKFVFWLMQTINVDSTTHKRYYLSNYQHIKIPLPPLSTQQKIVSILERAEQTKQMRTESDELTSKFLQAVFMEMFGDPVSNSKKFPIVKLNDVALIERNSITSDKIKKGDKYVGLEHLESESGRIIKIISVSAGDLKSNKFSFDEDCVLYGKLRPYLNKIALPDFEGICSTDIVPIRPIKEKSNKYFIAYILKQPYYIQLATDRSVGANLPRVSPRELELFEIISPPIELQQKFASIVEKVEAMRASQKSSKQEIENLFNTLMQKAFNGELVG